MENNLENLLEILNNKFHMMNNKEKRLEEIFKMYVYPENGSICADILGQLEHEVKCNCIELIHLIVNDRHVLNETVKGNQLLNIINMLDRKYGFLIKRDMIKQQRPFMLGGFDVNIEQNSSMHSICLRRIDGQRLQCNVSALELINIATNLINALDITINNSLYNIDTNSVMQYKMVSEKLNKTLEGIIKK